MPGKLSLAIVSLAAVMGLGCGVERVTAVSRIASPSIPPMPTPAAGHASIAGRVLDSNGQAVAGAEVRVAETDETAPTDDAGVYRLVVRADSTVTLVTTASGFAKSLRESVIVADQAMISQFDILLLPSDTMAGFAALATDQGASRGVMALRLHSLDSRCTTAGARVSVWPPKAATVFYSRPGAAPGIDRPDTGMTAVQPGVRIDAWLVGAVSPGGMLPITVAQADCRIISPSPSIDGLQFPGLRAIGPQALTEADLFLE